MAAQFPVPKVNLTDSGCPFYIGDVYDNSVPCQNNWISDVIRIVIRLKGDVNPFTTFAFFDTEALWDALFATTEFTAGAVIYSPDAGDKSTWTPQDPAITSNSWGQDFYSDYKGTKVMIPFWNLPANVQAEIYKSIKENPNSLECFFVTRQNSVIYLNDNGLVPTAPKWIPIQAAYFTEFSAAAGQAQMVNELRLTLDAGISAFLNSYSMSFDLLHKP
jgi:hypothetical protein